MVRSSRFAAAVALAVCVVTPFAVQSASAAPRIISASATGTTLIIKGTNLGPGAASVAVGSAVNLVGVPNADFSELTVTIPVLPPGSYPMNVKIPGKDGGYDESVLKVGAGS